MFFHTDRPSKVFCNTAHYFAIISEQQLNIFQVEFLLRNGASCFFFVKFGIAKSSVNFETKEYQLKSEMSVIILRTVKNVPM